MNTLMNLTLVSSRIENPLRPLARRCFTHGWLPAALATALFTMAPVQARADAPGALTIGDGEIYTAGGSGSTGQPPDESGSTVASAGLVIDTGTLSIAPTGFLDLKDNALIVRLTPYATVLGYVRNGFLNGPNHYWDGPGGVNSSTAAADPSHLTGLGIINNAEAQYTIFEGRALAPAAEVLVKYTYYGDADLDGVVTIADAGLFGTGSGWYHGDFNYDGAIDAADVELFNAGFEYWNPGQQPPTVPEPGTVSLLAVAGLFAASRRRKTL